MAIIYKIEKIANDQKKSEAVKDILYAADKEFIPALSKREYTTQVGFKDLFEGKRNPLPYFNSMIEQNFVIAYDDDQIVGFLSFRPETQFRFDLKNPKKNHTPYEEFTGFYITTAIVDPEYRKKGIGSGLYEALIDYAKTNKQPIIVRTWSTNKASIAIMDKYLFEEVYRIENDRGKKIDTIYYKREAYNSTTHH